MKFMQSKIGIRGWSVVVGSVLAAMSLSGAQYYVNPDPAKASDDYDGTAPVWAGGDSIAGPKLTLQGAMSIPGIRSGDKVYAAQGDYDMGGAVSSDGASNRVVVVGGVELIGAGADKTTIKGKMGDGENGIGPGAMRAVYLNQYAVIQGFSITGGRTESAADADKNRGGGISGSGGLVADCIIAGNVGGHRGGAANGGNTLLRCYIGENSSGDGNYGVYNNVKMIDCVYDCARPAYSGISSYNCLFKRSVPQGSSSSMPSVYNSIVINEQGWFTVFYNCRLVKAVRTDLKGMCVADSKTKDNLSGLASWYDPQTFRPKAGTELVDAGDDAYYALATNAWNGAWLKFAGKDYAGRVRKAGSAIDIGPGEYVWAEDGTLPGLSASVENLGDGTAKVVVTRDFESETLCTGFDFGGALVEFDKNGIGGSWTNIVPESMVWDCSLSPAYVDDVAHWYVNADPLIGSNQNRGYHRDCPFFTLQKAAGSADSGDVIHAAPGTYRDGGEMSGETRARVVLPAGVGLVSDGGAEATAIEGVLSGEPGMSGPDSVKCVALGSGAYVKGFTIRNGSTRVGRTDLTGEKGGGVSGPGAAIDCIITNCYAVRGGGAYNVRLIRCQLRDCHASTGATNESGSVANVNTAGVAAGAIYDSYIDTSLLNVSEARNSYIRDVGDNSAADGLPRLYNCLVSTAWNMVVFTNCIVASDRRPTYTVDEKTVFGQPFSFDGNLRPPTSGAAAVDAGDLRHYVYPAAFAHEAGKDISGGQRVYNGALDVGPGEYDWRGIFTERLNRRGVSVDAASAGVTTAEIEGLALQEGDTLKLALVFKNGGACSFRVVAADGGSAAVSADGTALAPDGDVYTFAGNAEDVHVVSVTCTSGSATVCGFKLPGFGMVVRIR